MQASSCGKEVAWGSPLAVVLRPALAGAGAGAGEIDLQHPSVAACMSLDVINYHFIANKSMDEVLCMYYTIDMLNMVISSLTISVFAIQGVHRKSRKNQDPLGGTFAPSEDEAVILRETGRRARSRTGMARRGQHVAPARVVACGTRKGTRSA